MAYRVLNAFLYGGASIGGPPNGHVFIFYFSFRFWRDLQVYVAH